MKGGKALPPNYNQEEMEIEEQPYIPDNPTPDMETLTELGFEDDELEMFFEMTNITEDQLVDRYLDIAQQPPYNLNWGTQNIAINADYMLGVYKHNGVEYTKHDIAQDAITSFYDEAEGGAQGLRKKKRGTRKHRTRKHRTRKHRTRQHKKRHTRRHRTRHRRRHN